MFSLFVSQLFPFEVSLLVLCRLLLIIVHLLIDCVGYFVVMMMIIIVDCCCRGVKLFGILI